MAPEDEVTDAVAVLLHEAAEIHHRVYRITDGADLREQLASS